MTTITPWEERHSDYEPCEIRPAMQAEIAELRAKLEQIEKQEPVAYFDGNEYYDAPVNEDVVSKLKPLYALPPSPVNVELVDLLREARETLRSENIYCSLIPRINDALSTAQAKPALTQSPNVEMQLNHLWCRVSNISGTIRGVFLADKHGNAPDVELKTERMIRLDQLRLDKHVRALTQEQAKKVRDAFETIRHSMVQAQIPGNDRLREIELSLCTAHEAIEIMKLAM